ncbi:MAG: N-acetylmuramoyl-L-alanine amidase, partial [Chloroflexota bacterium]
MLKRSRLTRRGFIRLAGGAALVALVNTVRWPDVSATSAARWESRWTIEGADITAADFATDPLQPDHAFTAVTVGWRGDASAGDSLDVAISVMSSDGSWSDWLPLQRDGHIPVSGDGWRHYLPLLQQGTDVRARVQGADHPGISQLQITVIDTTAGRDLKQSNPNERLDEFIIPRSEWGAQEELVHINQDLDEPLAWPPEYAPIQKVIIHHTDTEAGWEDPAAVVRAIFYYHAIILEWGDIGYNFLVDWAGNVYEGRYGGANVIGGHALQFNRGSMGIALIGNYDGMELTPAAFEALTRLIASRAPQVDARLTSDWFNWADVPNILGHGDVIGTECPGSEARSILPALRGELAGTDPIDLPKPIPLELPKIIDFTVSPTTVAPGDLVEIRATITNEGRDPLFSQGPDPGFVYDENSDYDTAYPKVDGAYRLAVGIRGDNDRVRPFRWGFGEP